MVRSVGLITVIASLWVGCSAPDGPCANTTGCRQYGLCSGPDKSNCYAADDGDCNHRSFACQNLGRCVSRDGVCIAKTAAHCEGSTECKDIGKCVLGSGECVAKGTSSAKFGDQCSKPSDCPPVLLCISREGRTRGFCSKKCSTDCPGAPGGAVASCVYTSTTDSSVKYCGFLCKYKDKSGQARTAKCPGYMKCSAAENPTGSGQHDCAP